MSYFNELYQKGKDRTHSKSLLIFGMVRDCGQNLKRNIPAIESIGAYFKDYKVVVLENNSKDNTKEILQGWSAKNNKVHIFLYDFDESKYKAIPADEGYFKYFQLNKLQKYYDYRNVLLEKVESIGYDSDYSMLIDMDVAGIDVKGAITSFGSDISWDAVTANGYSLSPGLRRRYHDTFALCEHGMEGWKQTIQMVEDYKEIFNFLRKGQPFIRVFSAFGGIAIYRTEAIKGLRYEPVINNYGQIQVRCEHFALYKAMAEKGYDKVFINPNMEVHYQKVTLGIIWKRIKEKFGLS